MVAVNTNETDKAFRNFIFVSPSFNYGESSKISGIIIHIISKLLWIFLDEAP
jgi:hypothetical protein